MEKRRHNRFFISLHAKVIADGKSFDGVIENVSDEGVASTITTHLKADQDFSPHKIVELSFQLPTGESINMNCEVRWFLRPSSNNSSVMLGLHVEDAPQSYKDWIHKYK